MAYMCSTRITWQKPGITLFRSALSTHMGTKPVTMLVQLTSAHEKHNLADF